MIDAGLEIPEPFWGRAERRKRTALGVSDRTLPLFGDEEER